MQHLSDEELLLLTKNYGNTPAGREAFDCFVSRHRQFAVNLARGYVRDPSTAEDMAQDGFVRLYEGLATYSPKGSARGLLLKIVRNTCLNHLGRNKRHARASERLRREQRPDVTPSQVEHAIGVEESRRLHAALDTLSGKQRESVRLRYFDNSSYAEIANSLGVTVNHVGVLLNQGLQKLRNVMGGGSVRESEAGVKKSKINAKKSRL